MDLRSRINQLRIPDVENNIHKELLGILFCSVLLISGIIDINFNGKPDNNIIIYCYYLSTIFLYGFLAFLCFINIIVKKNFEEKKVISYRFLLTSIIFHIILESPFIFISLSQ